MISAESIFKQHVATSYANNEALGAECNKDLNRFGSDRCTGSFSRSVVMNEIVKSSEISYPCSALSNDLGSLSISNPPVADGDQAMS